MAFENLFITTKRYIESFDSSEKIELDAVLSEDHKIEIKYTTNPVELGAEITDHAIVAPKRLTMVVQITDTPLGIAAVGELVDSVSNIFGSSTEENVTRSVAAYIKIKEIAETREPITIQTRLETYSNMLITNISTPTDKDTSRVALMTIQFTEIRIVNSLISELSSESLSGDTADQGSPGEKRGRVDPSESRDSSILKSVKDWVLGQ